MLDPGSLCVSIVTELGVMQARATYHLPRIIILDRSQIQHGSDGKYRPTRRA